MKPSNPRILATLFAVILGAQAAPEPLAQRFIPSEQRRQGEVRLIKQGSERRLQILLYTTSLGRALREMRKSEEKNWPPKSLWHPSSIQYLEKLDLFRRHLRTQTDAASSSEPYTYNLLIEWRTGGEKQPSIHLTAVTYTGEPDALEISKQNTFTTLTPPGPYVASNQFIIARESFNLSHEKTRKLLAE